MGRRRPGGYLPGAEVVRSFLPKLSEFCYFEEKFSILLKYDDCSAETFNSIGSISL